MDYRSYVSGAKNKAFKVISFFLVTYFLFCIPVYASDIVVGSDDVLFTRYRHVTYISVSGGTLSLNAYSSMRYSGGNCYYISASALKSGNVFILNPDNKNLICNLVGSSSGSLLSKVQHGANTSSDPAVRNTCSPAYDLSSFTFSDTSYFFDVSSFDYAYFYLFIKDTSVGTTYGLQNVQVFSRSAPLATPTPAVTPSPVPTPVVTPSSVPSSSPEFPDQGEDLSDYKFWATCYNQTWEAGSSSASPFTQRYTPSSVSSLSDFVKRDITNYVYVYNVRIPFRIQSSFSGSGLLDVYFRFAPINQFSGLDDDFKSSGTLLVRYSTPWVESSTGCSFNAVYDEDYGAAFDLFNLPVNNGTSEEFYFCYNVYVCAYASHMFTGYGLYDDVTIGNIIFEITQSSKVSNFSSVQILDNINNNIIKGNEQAKDFHDQETQEAQKAVDQLNSGLTKVTDTMSSWEILTMPVSVVQDLVGALSSDGETGLTFPSFSLMGYQLWPAYTFDLQTIADQFPLLYNSLHIITGIMIVGWFLHYLWRKWHILTGDDTPED